MGYEDELDRQPCKPATQVWFELVAGPLALVLGEPVNGQLDAAVLPDEQIAGDERAVRLEVEERLDPVAALDDLGTHSGREQSFLLGTPELRVVAVEQGRDAALVPVHRQEHVQRPVRALDVAVEGRPEARFLVRRDDRIDDHDGVGQLGVHRRNLRAQALGVIPLGMRRRPAPQPRPQLLHLHSRENLASRR